MVGSIKNFINMKLCENVYNFSVKMAPEFDKTEIKLPKSMYLLLFIM